MSTAGKIIYGVSGIGRGHTARAGSILESITREHRVVLFAFGESLKYFTRVYTNAPNVEVVPVAVPWIVSNSGGIDYAASARYSMNRRTPFYEINMAAMRRAVDFMGRPDLVVSDYEPTCAQFAYSLDVPLITIDQQSKFLDAGSFAPIQEFSAEEEAARIRYFFPSAHRRVACSFFKVPHQAQVEIIPPVIPENVLRAGRISRVIDATGLVVYISPYWPLAQQPDELLSIMRSFPGYTFHLYVPSTTEWGSRLGSRANYTVQLHDSPDYLSRLISARGAIATAGHALLSELTYLQIPLMAIPYRTFEQRYNAKMIQDAGCGVSVEAMTLGNVSEFLDRLPNFEAAYRSPQDLFVSGDGTQSAISIVQEVLSGR